MNEAKIKRNYELAYTALGDLADETPQTFGAVLCRVVLGVDVSFTRGRSTFLRFGVVSPAGIQVLSLHDAATHIANLVD